MSSRDPSLDLLGWNAHFEQHRPSDPTASCLRVVAEHRGEWLLAGADGSRRGRPSGRLRRAAVDPLDRPGVGDWVVVRGDPAETGADGKADAAGDAAGDGTAATPSPPDVVLVDSILPRSSRLVRKAAGEASVPQLVAANVDLVVLVVALDRDFTPRRLERLSAAVVEGGAQPFVLLNKSDLVEDVRPFVETARASVPGARVETASAHEDRGLDGLRRALAPGLTACLLGSSGVGKSTTLNALAGRSLQATGAVRDADRRGRHVTTARQLVALPSGALLIDTPGMREFSPWSDGAGDVAGFGDVDALAESCRFADCGHEAEPGCSVTAAVAAGRLDAARLEAWRKLGRELAFEASRHDARARSEQRKRWKAVTRSSRRRRAERW